MADRSRDKVVLRAFVNVFKGFTDSVTRRSAQRWDIAERLYDAAVEAGMRPPPCLCVWNDDGDRLFHNDKCTRHGAV